MDDKQFRKVDIDHEMQQSYLDYAMSVIVSRALPDARDGLKPVQRRILYAMHDLNLSPGSSYKKSARIVGEVLGKYHPHGDMAVYDAMARLAQDFTMRCMLVDGQGNFGSVDGDPPAAMRYTEARLSAASVEMLKQIEKGTVDFSANFDGTLKEPDVLPSALPNLLLNGASGIAVGMATNIPPHNLGELVDAATYLLHQWEKIDDVAVEDLMKFIKGPDFPTGGIILQDPNGEGLPSIYGSGKGKVIVQARAHIEEMERGKSRIILTELPYMVNKSSLISRIAELVREGNIEGISDLRDESDRNGLRIVIELSKTVDPENVLRKLYKHTPMQSTFGINMLALVDQQPRLLSIKAALKVFIDHRLVVIQRRSEFDLEKARQRAHILEGLRIAIANLDEIIKIIRNSPDADEAKIRLIKRFKLSDIQAQAILDMPLRRLAALERKKIEDEYKELVALIKQLELLLKSPRMIRDVCVEELAEIKANFNEKRKTQIIGLKEGDSIHQMLTITDVTPSQDVLIGINEAGMIARTSSENSSWLTGKDAPIWLVRTDTHQTLYLTTTTGRAAAVPVHAVPEAQHVTEGLPVYKVAPLPDDDPLGAVFVLPQRSKAVEESYVMTITRGGMVKKTLTSELPGASSQSFVLCKVNDGDSLGWAIITKGKNDILFATMKGMCIRFNEEEVRPMGLATAGVSGIKLAVRDEVVSADIVEKSQEVVLAASDGRGKRIPEKDFPTQGRYGQGVIGWKLGPGIHVVGMVIGSKADKFVTHFLKSASKVKRMDDVQSAGRAAIGKSAFEVKPGDQVISLTPIVRAIVSTAAPGENNPSSGGDTRKKRSGTAPDKPKPVKVDKERKTAPAKTTKKTTAKPKASSKVKPVKKPSGTSARQSTGKSKPETVKKKPATKPTGTKKTGVEPKQTDSGQLELKI